MQTMTQLGVVEMPDAYILKRWTWDADEDLVEEGPGRPAVMPEESKKLMSLALMCADFKTLAIQGNQSEDGRRLVKTHLKGLKKDLADLKREAAKRAKKATAAANAHAAASDPLTAPNGPPPATNPTTSAPTRRAASGPQAAPRRRSTKAAATRSSQNTAPGPIGPTSESNQDGYPVPNMQADSDSSQAPDIRDPRKSNTKGRKRKHAFQNPLNINPKEVRTCKQCGSTSHDYRTCLQRGELPDEEQKTT